MNNKVIFIAIVVLIFGLISFLLLQPSFSPSLQQSEGGPLSLLGENIISFAYLFSFELDEITEEVNSRGSGRTGYLTCEGEECRNFRRCIEVDGNPLDKNAFFWIAKKSELDELVREVFEFAESFSCDSEECKKIISITERRIEVTPKETQPSQCDSSPSAFSLTVTGANILGDCNLARLDAFDKAKKQLEEFIKNSCGANCGSVIRLNALVIDADCRTENGVKKIDVRVEGTIQCKAKPLHDKYELCLNANVCVQCVDSDGPQKIPQASGPPPEPY